MYQLITKKDQRYWLSKGEVTEIRRLLQQGVNFITLQRYDKTINSFDIHDIGIPDWAYPMLKQGFKIEFDGNTPVIGLPTAEMRYEEGRWQRYEGIAPERRQLKSFEDYIGEIKKLN